MHLSASKLTDDRMTAGSVANALCDNDYLSHPTEMFPLACSSPGNFFTVFVKMCSDFGTPTGILRLVCVRSRNLFVFSN